MSIPEYPIILVLGVTGTGKSSFIKSLTENPDEDTDSIGHGLEPHTLCVTERYVKVGERTVILVDTPGLDHPGGVPEAVSKWMSERHRPIRSVDGVILLHPINRNRMTEDSISSLNLRRDIARVLGVAPESNRAFHKTVLATTMWSIQDSGTGFEDDEYLIQEKRERELRCDWWRILEMQGAIFQRYDNSLECAKDIVSDVLRAQLPDAKTVNVRDHLIIAVIGSSQAGKTSFINALAGTTSPETTFGMNCIEPYEVEFNGVNVILLDTPGLDSSRDPERVSRMIADWLKPQAKAVRKDRLYLDGIVVVHPILSDHEDKSGRIIMQSTLMNQVNKLFGGLNKVYDERDVNAYHRVVLATTMWDKLGKDDIGTALKKEERIQKIHWNIMRAAGAPAVRFNNTTQSAQHLMNMIIQAKMLSSPLYHYRKKLRELDQVKWDMESNREEMGIVLEEGRCLRRKGEVLRRIPEIWRASCFVSSDVCESK